MVIGNVVSAVKYKSLSREAKHGTPPKKKKKNSATVPKLFAVAAAAVGSASLHVVAMKAL